MEKTDQKSSGNKGQRILVQIGVIIIVLFTLITLAVGNMITMSSFSTALSSNLTVFSLFMERLIDSMQEYKSLPWLLEYWRDNADIMFSDVQENADTVDITGILKKLSKISADQVTAEEAASLSEDEQKLFALFPATNISACAGAFL